MKTKRYILLQEVYDQTSIFGSFTHSQIMELDVNQFNISELEYFPFLLGKLNDDGTLTEDDYIIYNEFIEENT